MHISFSCFLFSLNSQLFPPASTYIVILKVLLWFNFQNYKHNLSSLFFYINFNFYFHIFYFVLKVSGEQKQLIHVWNPSTCQLIHTFKGHKDAVTVSIRIQPVDRIYSSLNEGKYDMRSGLMSSSVCVDKDNNCLVICGLCCKDVMGILDSILLMQNLQVIGLCAPVLCSVLSEDKIELISQKL